jgi:hypothetical protein
VQQAASFKFSKLEYQTPAEKQLASGLDGRYWASTGIRGVGTGSVQQTLSTSASGKLQHTPAGTIPPPENPLNNHSDNISLSFSSFPFNQFKVEEPEDQNASFFDWEEEDMSGGTGAVHPPLEGPSTEKFEQYAGYLVTYLQRHNRDVGTKAVSVEMVSQLLLSTVKPHSVAHHEAKAFVEVLPAFIAAMMCISAT